MKNTTQLLPHAIANLFAATAHTGIVTLADRYGLLTALTNETLTEDEQQAIDRLLHAVARGRLQLSAS